MGQDIKSSAIHHFFNDSPDRENAYFINVVMEEVLNNLQKIMDLWSSHEPRLSSTGIRRNPALSLHGNRR
jgi:hypothetical protein